MKVAENVFCLRPGGDNLLGLDLYEFCLCAVIIIGIFVSHWITKALKDV